MRNNDCQRQRQEATSYNAVSAPAGRALASRTPRAQNQVANQLKDVNRFVLDLLVGMVKEVELLGADGIAKIKYTQIKLN
jgi:hypothetical protein